MNTYYLVLLFSILLYFILLHNYSNSESLPTSVSCSPEKEICVVCPHFDINTRRNKFNQYIQIGTQVSFQLLGTKGSFIRKNQCKDVLGLFDKNQEGELTLPTEVHNAISKGTTVLKSSHEINFGSGNQYHLTVSGVTDFLLFYQNSQPHYPTIKMQLGENIERLMKMGRCLGWAVLFALFLKVVDRKLGLFTEMRDYPLPLVQFSILGFILYSSYDIERFQFLFIAEPIFLAYLLLKIEKNVNTQKITIISLSNLFIFFLSLYYQEINIIADFFCLYSIKKNIPQLKKASPKIKTITAFVLFLIVTNSLDIIGLLNLFVYSAYATKVIVISLSFLILQGSQVSEKLREKLSQTAEKYLDSQQ